MKKFMLCAVAVVVLAGCQPKEEITPAVTRIEVTPQRKEGAREMTSQAMALLGQQNYQGAVAALDAAIKLNPADPDPYLILGQILLKAGEFARASEFLDNAAKNFPDNGMIFYMLSISNKLVGKKLPAVLAARRSFEIFKNANDQENAQRSAVLLQQIIDAPDATANAK